MITIHKFQLPIKEVATIEMPEGACIIRCAGVDGGLFVWAVVDTEKPFKERVFKLFKTGGEMPDNRGGLIYHGCGSIFIQQELMLYIFEEVKI